MDPKQKKRVSLQEEPTLPVLESQSNLIQQKGANSKLTLITEELEEEEASCPASCICEVIQQQRVDELISFIDEFVNSEEYAEYIRKKQNLVTVGTQFDISDIRRSKSSRSDYFPEGSDLSEEDKDLFIKKAISIFKFEEEFEKYCRSLAKMRIVTAQEQSIQVIRNKIAEARKIFFSTLEARTRRKQMREDSIFYKYVKEHDIDLSKLPPNTKLRAKVLSYNENLKKMKSHTKENLVKIVSKLLSEYKEKLKKKYPKYGMNIQKGRKPSTISTSTELPTISGVEEFDANNYNLLWPQQSEENSEWVKSKDSKRTIELKAKKSKTRIKSVKSSEGRKAKKVKSKSEKLDKKKHETKGKSRQKDKEDEFLVPNAPIVNYRQRLNIDQFFKASDMIKQFEIFDKLMENRYAFRKMSDLDAPKDPDFVCSPEVPTFKGFRQGWVYKLKLYITNSAGVVKRIKFSKISSTYGMAALYFEVQTQGMKIAYPGIPIEYDITFIPSDLMDLLQAELIFTVSHSKKYFQYTIPVICLPVTVEISITPKTVDFGQIPIWRCREHTVHIKYLTISNDVDLPHKITMRKMPNPWDEEYLLTRYMRSMSVRRLSKLKALEKFQERERASIDSLVAPLSPREEGYVVIRLVLRELLDNMFGYFILSDHYLYMEEPDDKRVKIYFKEAEHVGSYSTKYQICIYQQMPNFNFEEILSEEILVRAETTDLFISTSPSLLDFGLCYYDNAYQHSFKVINGSGNTHSLVIKLPLQVRDYVSTSVTDLIIQAYEERTVCVRLLPRKDIQTEWVPYFDRELSILEFPIRIHLLSKQYNDAPPIKMIIYAILLDPSNIHLKPLDFAHVHTCNKDMILDLGRCSLNECAKAKVELQNNCNSVQYYFFPDLPKYITIKPNYGFGKLAPLEKKELTVFLQPSYEDMPDFKAAGDSQTNSIAFRLTVDTLANRGKYKKKYNFNKLKKMLDFMLVELKVPDNKPLIGDIMALKRVIRGASRVLNFRTLNFQHDAHFNSMATAGSSTNDSILINEIMHGESTVTHETVTDETLKEIYFNWDLYLSRHLWLQANVIAPLYEFSHQYVELPITPVGSYSTATINLKPIQRPKHVSADKEPYHQKLQYTIQFIITGGSNELQIEPTAGVMSKDEVCKLTILAQPEVPLDIIESKAKILKYNEVLKKKLEEIKIRRELDQEGGKAKKAKPGKQLPKNRGKTKNGGKAKSSKKGGTSKKLERLIPSWMRMDDGQETVDEEEVDIQPHELLLTYFDMYPAELAIWRDIQPYVIKSQFVCKVVYVCEGYIQPDILFLEVSCKVIRPDFIHNVTTQNIDFGSLVVGQRKQKILHVQNIAYYKIYPITTLLNPLGPFTFLNFGKPVLDTEYIWKIPITFAPQVEAEEKHYFEVKTEKTINRFVLSGEGLGQQVELVPEFNIFRFVTTPSKLVNFVLQITNKTTTPIEFCIQKVSEVEGMISRCTPGKSSSSIKMKNSADKVSKGKGSATGKPLKTHKVDSFTDELTEDEKRSICKDFKVRIGDSYFEYTENTLENGTFTIDAESSMGISFQFGLPDILSKKIAKIKAKRIKEENAALKELLGGTSKKRPRSRDSKGSKGSSGKKVKVPKVKKIVFSPEEYSYVAKFNILIGTSTFFKDIIIIGSFH